LKSTDFIRHCTVEGFLYAFSKMAFIVHIAVFLRIGGSGSV